MARHGGHDVRVYRRISHVEMKGCCQSENTGHVQNPLTTFRRIPRFQKRVPITAEDTPCSWIMPTAALASNIWPSGVRHSPMREVTLKRQLSDSRVRKFHNVGKNIQLHHNCLKAFGQGDRLRGVPAS
jgi:hypothetical protein